MRRYEETGEVRSRPGSGDIRVTTVRQGEYVAQYACTNPPVIVAVPTSQLQRTNTGVNSSASIRKGIVLCGLWSRRSLRVPMIIERFVFIGREIIETDIVNDDFRMRVSREPGRLNW